MTTAYEVESEFEFCEAYTGGYLTTDELIDTPRGIEWRRSDGRLVATCASATVAGVMHHIYIHYK